MTDRQQAESGTERLLRLGTLALTVLSPVINTLAARLADRLERGGISTEDVEVLEIDDVQNKPRMKKVVLTDGKQKENVVVKQPLSDTLRERSEVLVQELEDLVERGAKLSQSLVARSSDVTHDLAERASNASQDLLKRSEEIRKRGKKLNKGTQKVAKDLNRRSRKVAKELSRRSEKVTRELSKRSHQATRQLSERSGTFWVISGFVVGLAGAGIVAYLLIRRRAQQQQQLEAEQSFSLSQDGYQNTSNSAQRTAPIRTTTDPVIQPAVHPSLAEESASSVALVEQENRMPAAQSAPSNAAFIGVVGTRRYYPVSTPLEQLAASETENNDVIYFSTEEEAQSQGYSSDL
ncbi:MAG: hypothetical protein JO011_22070 [Ktedonobacteraceae bacterium]|nr:hypothetical protein [Ktedonobacteraceae bacterium]MBV9713594.1 hypothetical protein [Ktedonobacteraceae bacterium]